MSETLQGLSAYLRAQAVALDAIPRQAFGGEAARSAKTLRDWADGVDALVASSTPEPELFDQAWPMPAKTGPVITGHGCHQQARWPMPFNVPTVSTLTSAIAGALSGTWHCMRVWEAWHHGTMSEDDFEPVAESETPREIAEIVAGMYALAQGGSLDEAEEVPSHG